MQHGQADTATPGGAEGEAEGSRRIRRSADSDDHPARRRPLRCLVGEAHHGDGAAGVQGYLPAHRAGEGPEPACLAAAAYDDQRIPVSLLDDGRRGGARLQVRGDAQGRSDGAGPASCLAEGKLGRVLGARVPLSRGHAPEGLGHQGRPVNDVHDPERALAGRRLGGRPFQGVPVAGPAVHAYQDRAGVLTGQQAGCCLDGLSRRGRRVR